MKEILTIILCVFLFITIVLAILFHDRVRNIKKMIRKMADEREARRQAEEDEYFKRTSNKYYKPDDKPKFKDDYFKSAETPKDKGESNSRQEETTTRRTVETSDGVRIIDDRRNKPSDRKIFDESEGEYVDYVEVKGEE
jgi:uncharacterized protein YxeA